MKLQILKAEVQEDIILTTAEYKDREAKFRINKNEFEKFVDSHKYRDWIMDSSNHLGGHIQVSGKSDWEEVYSDRFMMTDLIAEYITTTKFKPIK